MSDTLNADPSAQQTEPSSAPALDASQTAAMREAWIAAGHDPARFDAATAAPVQPVAAPDAPALAPDGSPIQTLCDMKLPSLSQGQAYEMAQALRDAGMSEGRIQAALAADGVQAAGTDTRTDAQREFDDSFGAPAPNEYRVDYMGRGAERMDVAELTAFNEAATSWASAVGLPVGVGEAVIERAMDVGQWWAKASPVDRELFKREQSVALERLAGGPEEAQAAITRAAQALAAGVEAQGFDESHMRALLDAGVANDAGFIMHLANQGTRRAARG